MQAAVAAFTIMIGGVQYEHDEANQADIDLAKIGSYMGGKEIA